MGKGHCSKMYSYMALRYVLIIATYYQLAKDYKSLSQQIALMYTEKKMRGLMWIPLILRIINLVTNEGIIFAIINTTNLANSLGIGLILNFSAGVIVCELDDLAMSTQIADSLKKEYKDFLFVNVKKSFLPTNQGLLRLRSQCIKTARNNIRDFQRCCGLFSPKNDDEKQKGLKSKPVKVKVNLITLHKFILFGCIGFNICRDLIGLFAPDETRAVDTGFPLSVSSSLQGYGLENSIFEQYNASAWCAKNNVPGEYIQVQSGQAESWTRIQFQGRADNKAWVTKVNIKYSYDGQSFKNFNEEPLIANVDGNTKVEILFVPDILAQYIRVIIVEFRGLPCLRFEAFLR